MPYIKCVNTHQQGIAGVDGLKGDEHDVPCDQRAVGLFVIDGYDYEIEAQEYLPHCSDCGPEMMHELRQMGHEYIITADLTQIKEHTS
jgi:hypothetical protein